MVVTIYQMGPSPPCRAVLLTMKALGVPVQIKEVDLLNGGSRTPEYLQMNPQHTVPTMVDGSLTIGESRAIMEYLCDAYGKTDALLPKEAKKRAVINARLYFDATTLSSTVAVAYGYPAFRGTEQTPASLVALEDALNVLNSLIGDKLYLAADQLTIADISVAVTISNLNEAFGHDISKFKNIVRWLNNAKKNIVGYEEINQKQIEVIKAFLKQKAEAANQ